MSLLNKNQRAVIRADTGIDPILLDRVVDAFDALGRDDVEMYRHYMRNAIAQQGIPTPIDEKERPTAIDRAKTYCIRAYADQHDMTFKKAARYLARITNVEST